MDSKRNQSTNKQMQPNSLTNSKRAYSSLYRCKTNNQIPFFSKNSPIQPSYFIQKAETVNERKQKCASQSTKSIEKDNSFTKAKQNKTFKIFNIFKQTITNVHKNILSQYKRNIKEKRTQTNQLKDIVTHLSSNLARSNEEFDVSKESACLIKTYSLQLSNDCHRIYLENEELDYEINKLREENDNTKNTILTLEKEKTVLINTIKTIHYEIEEMKRTIQRVPRECDSLENEIKNIKTGILICQKRSDEVRLDMEKNDKRIEWLNRQMGNLKSLYESHQLAMNN